MADLATAIELAQKAHTGQTDHAGVPYIEHPMAVMVLVATERQKIIAALHDTVEDTWVTLDYLLQLGFTTEVVAAVDALTKRPREPLEESMARVLDEPTGDALTVKLADVAHNAGRLDKLEDELRRRRLQKKYEKTAMLLGTTLRWVLERHQGSPYR